jgi:hypothetical protein
MASAVRGIVVLDVVLDVVTATVSATGLGCCIAGDVCNVLWTS